MTRLQYLLGCLSLIAAPALAQSVPGNAPATNSNNDEPQHMRRMPPPMAPAFGDWWKNSEIAQKINLTDTQKQQLQHIFSDHRTNLVILRGNFENEEGKLRALIDQDQPPDDAQVLKQVDQVSAARSRLDHEFAMITLGFRKVLSLDQWKQLQALTLERFKSFKFRHHGEHAASPDASSEPK